MMHIEPSAYGRLNPVAKDAPITRRERAVLDAMLAIERKQRRPATARDIAAALGVSHQAVLEHLRRLAAKGHLRAVPYGKGRYRYMTIDISGQNIERIGDG